MRSKFLALAVPDFIKGLIMAILTALVTGVYELVQSGWVLTFDWLTFKPIVMAGVGAALAYLIKNFFTNSTGEILKAERK